MFDPTHLQVFDPDEHLLIVVLSIGALASALIIALSVVALARRRSRSYLLVTLAVSMLLVRTLFGVFSVGGTMDPTAHHVLEHGMDVLAAVFLIGAIWTAGIVDQSNRSST